MQRIITPTTHPNIRAIHVSSLENANTACTHQLTCVFTALILFLPEKVVRNRAYETAEGCVAFSKITSSVVVYRLISDSIPRPNPKGSPFNQLLVFCADKEFSHSVQCFDTVNTTR